MSESQNQPSSSKAADPLQQLDRTNSSLRLWISLGIVAFLLSQALIPLSYYLRDEPTSERFAWRMFSSIDLSTWDTQVSILFEKEDGHGLFKQDVPIAALLQETYVKTVQRAQFDVVEEFMCKLTEQPGVLEVRFVARGTFPSGKSMQPIRLSMRRGKSLVNHSTTVH